MSGTGKSTVLDALRALGFETVDTDVGEWGDGALWHEERITELLDRERDATLYQSGTVSNQGRFYPRFDAVVLLSAPTGLLLERIATRTTNDYGKKRWSRSCARRARTRSTRRYRSTPWSPSSSASALRSTVSSSPWPDGS
jgi:dephospho-CoA kinase